ncbi:unnamed protein product [Caenorhabditis bovis]|uniref:Uncharacterized protein n=1 Tax=Caenorhabditis bovis TaxID=2654633 RepID=A0A8S1FDR1_9PELO|nr:unnamed protein product [Caenorhabditis bovis]
MPKKIETANQKRNRIIKNSENLAKVLQASKTMQMRFELIPTNYLNNITVAGVRDMNLGRPKNGKPVGGNVVRFNNPVPNTNSDFHRICIDPNGIAQKTNSHIPVSAETVNSAAKIQKGLKVGGKVLLVVSIIATGVRIGKAIYDEVHIDEEIEALENIIDCLTLDLKSASGVDRDEINKALNFANDLLDDARDCKKNPSKKTLLTTVCCGFEWGGAAAFGYAGAQTGALIGAPGGPIGMIAGAVTGSVIGAVTGSELGRSAVENAYWDEGPGTQMHGNLLDFGDSDKAHGEVLDINGQGYIGGKGLDVGTNATLFQFGDSEDQLSIAKAGANFGLTADKGLDVSVESKVLWLEHETEHVKIGGGLNIDTGVKVSDNGVEMSALGFGFSVGNDGVGIKLPFFNALFK